MSKKKSYMNKDNILSEGFLERLIRSFISGPINIGKNVNQTKIKKLEKELEASDKKQTDLRDEFKVLMKKHYGVNVKDGDLKKKMNKLGA